MHPTDSLCQLINLIVFGGSTNDLGLLLVSTHGQLIYRIVEFGRKKTIFVLKCELFFLCGLLLYLVLLINEFLFSLDIFEHVFGLWQDDIVGENLRILIVESAQLGQPRFNL